MCIFILSQYYQFSTKVDWVFYRYCRQAGETLEAGYLDTFCWIFWHLVSSSQFLE